MHVAGPNLWTSSICLKFWWLKAVTFSHLEHSPDSELMLSFPPHDCGKNHRKGQSLELI